jgi:hypothetical protein
MLDQDEKNQKLKTKPTSGRFLDLF